MIFIALALAASLQISLVHASGPAEVSQKPDRLTREEAVVRAKQLTRIHYSLSFDITGDDKTFGVVAHIAFQLRTDAKDYGSQTFLELRDAQISAVNVNGLAWSGVEIGDRYDGRRIRLNLGDLKKSNTVEITYTRAYQNDGTGLHRFADPEDKRPYLYTHFEPYHAHLVFPCFDQPDLKATYSVDVKAPKEWQVISNAPESKIAENGGNKHWTFARSKPFSTYLFALIAGPYSVWKSRASDGGDDIPLRLFARRSMAKYVEPGEWFKITKQGLDFYAREFGVPYPFLKYDQIIVPEFNMGAMENVGAITFSERTIFRTRVTDERRRARADVILHEMAHQWFGNLTTMRWWNGLWLNESFATFLATLALDKATEYEGAWLSFYSHDKVHAYREDRLETTHPVEQPVSATDQAVASFDSITYGKGAASLQQLYALVGEEDFREGLQRYFEAYAYQNTTISDFFRKMGEASGIDLLKWQQLWLQTPGVNTVRAEWSCAPDPESGAPAILKFQLVQGPDGEIRTHRTQVGLYSLPRDGKSPMVQLYKKEIRRGAPKRRRRTAEPEQKPEAIAVTHSQRENEVPELVEQACPDFVFPNVGDRDYIQVELDPISLARAKKAIWRISDPLTRAMVWNTLWDQVVDAKLPATEYLETVMRHLPREKNATLLNRLLATLWAFYPQDLGALQILEEPARKKWADKLESWSRNQLAASAAGSDIQLVWFQHALRLSQTASAQRWLKRLLKGETKIKGLEIEKDRRWEIVRALARLGGKGVREIITEEQEKDPSDFGRKQSMSSFAALPESEEKAKWIAQVTQVPAAGTPPMALSDFRALLGGIYDVREERWTQQAATATFARLAMSENTPRADLEEYESELAEVLVPFACSTKASSDIRSFLSAHGGLKPAVSKPLRQTAQAADRCVKARAVLTTLAAAGPGNGPSPSLGSDARQP